MGADFYSSELYWNNLKPLDFEKGRQTAESIDDIEEKKKIIALIEKFEGYHLEGNFYHRDGSVKELGPISMLIAAYQGYGDPSDSNSLITEIDELSEHSEILNAIGFTLNPKELYREIAEKRVLPLTKAISKLTSIPDDVIEILSGYEGELDLSGLVEITDSAAASLSKHRGGYLYLSSVTELSDVSAECLANYQGELGLGGLKVLSKAAAESFSKYVGDLGFWGLLELSDAAAESLSKHHHGDLYLDGLTKLSNAAAESLSKHQGHLYLMGLTQLSDPAAESLSKHQGYIALDGIRELSAKAKKILSANPDIQFPQ